jgi:hypothetical protein
MQKALSALPTTAGISPMSGDVDADPAAAGFATDPHSKRIVLDLAEWYDRLARLAELRK